MIKILHTVIENYTWNTPAVSIPEPEKSPSSGWKKETAGGPGDPGGPGFPGSPASPEVHLRKCLM